MKKGLIVLICFLLFLPVVTLAEGSKTTTSDSIEIINNIETEPALSGGGGGGSAPTPVPIPEDTEPPLITNVEIVSSIDDGEPLDTERPNILNPLFHFKHNNDLVGTKGDEIYIKVEVSDNLSGVKEVYAELETYSGGRYYQKIILTKEEGNSYSSTEAISINGGTTLSSIPIRIYAVDFAGNNSWKDAGYLYVMPNSVIQYKEKELQLDSPEQYVKVSFSKQMDINTFKEQILVIKSKGPSAIKIPDSEYAIILSNDKKSAYVSLKTIMEPNANYYIVVHENVKDTTGNALANPMYFKVNNAIENRFKVINVTGGTEEVDPYQEFTIELNDYFDSSTLNDETIYVTDSNDNKRKVNYHISGKKIIVGANKYDLGKTYTLHLTTALKSISGANLSDPLEHTFTVSWNQNISNIVFEFSNGKKYKYDTNNLSKFSNENIFPSVDLITMLLAVQDDQYTTNESALPAGLSGFIESAYRYQYVASEKIYTDLDDINSDYYHIITITNKANNTKLEISTKGTSYENSNPYIYGLISQKNIDESLEELGLNMDYSLDKTNSILTIKLNK